MKGGEGRRPGGTGSVQTNQWSAGVEALTGPCFFRKGASVDQECTGPGTPARSGASSGRSSWRPGFMPHSAETSSQEGDSWPAFEGLNMQTWLKDNAEAITMCHTVPCCNYTRLAWLSTRGNESAGTHIILQWQAQECDLELNSLLWVCLKEAHVILYM